MCNFKVICWIIQPRRQWYYSCQKYRPESIHIPTFVCLRCIILCTYRAILSIPFRFRTSSSNWPSHSIKFNDQIYTSCKAIVCIIGDAGMLFAWPHVIGHLHYWSFHKNAWPDWRGTERKIHGISTGLIVWPRPFTPPMTLTLTLCFQDQILN